MSSGYVLDSTALLYMLESFPRFIATDIWSKFLEQCECGSTVSSRETKKIVEKDSKELVTEDWLKKHSKIFKPIGEDESLIMGEYIDEQIFIFWQNKDNFIRNLPASIPFIIVMAKHGNKTVVIHKHSKDEAKIKDICKKKKIECITVEDYLLRI